jgi:cytochrome P450
MVRCSPGLGKRHSDAHLAECAARLWWARRGDHGELRGRGMQTNGAILMADLSVEFPAVQPANSVGLLALIRAFRSDLLGVFSANFYADRRVSFRRFGHRFVCFNDPDDINHVLNTEMDRYQPNVLARRLLEPFVGRGLLFAEGEEWRRQHGQLAPFFQPRNMERLIVSFHQTVERTIGGWPADSELERNLLVDFRRLTLAVIARSLLSIDDESGTARLADFASRAEGSGALLKWQDYVALLVSDAFAQPSDRRAVATQWRHWVEGLLDGRPPIENIDEARDMLDLIRAGRKESAGGSASRQEMVDQVATMLSAGFITTAVALFWSVLMLALFPARQEAVRRDLCCGDASAPPNWDSLRSSRTAMAFFYETLRLFPPAYIIAREARLEDALGDFRIPARATVIIAPWLVHRHSSLWSKPHRFDPDRFLQDGRVVTPRGWMPFGVGPRVCIGSAFATLEVLIVLRQLLSRYTVGLRGQPPRPIGRVTLVPEFQPTFILRPL